MCYINNREESEEVMEENNIDIEEPKKKPNIGKIIFIIIFIILIGVIGYLTFTRIIERQNKVENQVQETKQDTQNEVVEIKEIDLDINSGLAQSLFNLVNLDTVPMTWKQVNGVTAEEMTYEDKFKLALNATRSLTENKINCSNIKNEILEVFGTDAYIECGDQMYTQIAYDPTTKEWEESDKYIAYADVYSEKEIKAAMYQIFGKDYYERKTKVDDSSFDYFYFKSQEGYIRIHQQKGGMRPTYNETLKSAKMTNEAVELTVSADSGNGPATLKYTFKYNQKDNSYYFDKLVIEK